MIKLNSLNKFYNKHKQNEIHVINNTTLELPDTGFVTFLGHSGSGKTTLLNVIGGIDSFSGNISFDDTTYDNYQMNKIDEYRSKNIGYVFQNYNLLKNDTVYDNIKISLELIGLTDEEEVEKRINSTLKAVGLYDYRRRIASELSGGQQQRVSIARALAKNAKLIIADEPTGNLDKENSIQIMNILRSLSNNILVLLVTHSEEFASHYSDRIIRIKDGAVIEDAINTPFSSSLDNQNNNKVYLQDLEKNKLENDLFDYSMYFKKDATFDKAKFRVVLKDGIFYIDSSCPVKIVGEKNKIEFVDGHKLIVKHGEEEQINFDSTEFNNDFFSEKENSINTKYFIKQSWKNIKSQKLFGKIMNFGLLAVTAILAALVFYILINANKVYPVTYADDYYLVKEFNDPHFQDNIPTIYNDLKNDENVLDLKSTMLALNYGNLQVYNSGYIQKSSKFSNDYKLISKSSAIDVDNGNLNLDINQVVIDRKIIDNMTIDLTKEDRLKTYSNWIDKEINIQYKNFEIVGICDTGSCFVFFSNSIVDSYNVKFGVFYTEYKDNKYIIGSENPYEIVQGKKPSDAFDVVVPDDAYHNIQLNSNYLATYSGNYILANEMTSSDAFSSSGMRCKIVGTYKLKSGRKTSALLGENKTIAKIYNMNTFKSGEDTIYRGYDYQEYDSDGYSKYNYFFSDISDDQTIFDFSNDMELLRGTHTKQKNDIVVSKNTGYSIGDSISVGYVYDGRAILQQFNVVGISNNFNSREFEVTKEYFSEGISKYSFFTNDNNILYNQVILKTNNPEDIEQKYNITLISDKEDALKNSGYYEVKYDIIFSIVIIFIMCVYVYFIMRSRMIHNIYNIGVYRAIGATKKKVTHMFLIENLETVATTCLIGYLLVYCIFIYLGPQILEFAGEYESYHSILLYTGLIGIGAFIIEVLIGMLPIWSLLRKNPSEILSKYDI